MKSKVSPTQRALNVWAIILIIWAVYRANMHLPVWFDEFIAKPIIFILPVYWYITKVEHKKFLESIWFKSKQLVPDLIDGLTVGGVFIASAVAANYVLTRKFIFFRQTTEESILSIILLAIATAVSEEILSRGFVLKRLYEESKNIYTSSFFASILFFFLHVPILFTSTRITGNVLLLVMATDMMLSLVSSFIFIKRKSIVVPILIHAFYNITILLFL